MLLQQLSIVILWSFLLSFGNSLHAEDRKPPAKKSGAHANLNMDRVMHITYGSPSWNLDSTKVDSAYLILRDNNTGKLVQIQLEETEPDSSQFSGQFSVQLSDSEKVSPEIYIPPKELRGSDKDNKKLYEMIQAGKLQRKPVIVKKNEKGQPVLDVYDTREQAEAGLKAYEEEQRLGQELRHKKALKPMTSSAATAAAAAAERKAQLEKLALEAVKNVQDRVRMEQIERQKATERAEQARKMSEAERAARRARAVIINGEAMALYDQGDFVKAEGKFKQAVDLDPDNKDYYYKYGITLYRNQKFNDALVALKIAKVQPALDLEKKYYMGLVHFRLSELDNAIRQFQEVGKSSDPNLGPSSVFYVGVIQFAQEKYDAAKKSFETVIDTSKDPRLDDQAEEYIDKIAGAMAFQKLRENKFTLMAVVGAMYDSNVLLTPDSLPGGAKPSNIADFRLMTIADLQYRPVLNEHHEWAPHFTANLTNSLKSEAAPADPFMYTLAAPYSYTGMAWKKGYKFTANPGYDILYMDPTKSGKKTQQQASSYLGLDNTFVMSKDWVSTYSLEYRNNKSYDVTANGPDDANSTQYTLRTIQTVFLDKGRKQSLLPNLGIIRNAAKGSNKSYNRYDLGATYVKPVAWGMGLNLGVAYYQMTYPTLVPTVRVDKNYTFTAGVSKPIKDWVIWGLAANYMKNASTDVASAYTKFSVITTATFITNF